jgi:hypothetical protein
VLEARDEMTDDKRKMENEASSEGRVESEEAGL